MQLQIQNNTSSEIRIPTIVNYIFLFFIFTQSIYSSIFKISNTNTILVFILLSSVFFGIFTQRHYLKLLKTPPMLIWTIWCIYSFFNWKISALVNTNESLVFILKSFVYPIITMCIVYYEGIINMKRTTIVVVIALTFYVTCGLIFQDALAYSLEDTVPKEKGGSILGNMLPLNACALSFFAVMTYVKGWMSRKWLYLLLALSFASILFVATRKAFVGWGIIVLMYYLSTSKDSSLSMVIKLIFFGVIAYFAFYYILDNTHLGERLMTIEDQGEKGNKSDIKALSFLGDRAIQYILSWDLFLKHPINGIGLHNFSIKADFPFVLHSEYMVQLCECGIIGTSLYLLFVKGIISRIFKSYKYNKKVFFASLGGMLCVLFINCTAWTYQSTAYFAMYGMILAAFYHETKKEFMTKQPN